MRIHAQQARRAVRSFDATACLAQRVLDVQSDDRIERLDCA
jgi:hypothetical protein